MARYGSPDDSGQSPDETTRFAGQSESGRRNPGPPPVPAGPSASPYTTGNAPTQYADYRGYQEQPAPPHFARDSGAATPWFRKRPVLITWITLIVVMIALVIWGIIQLASRGPGDVTVPATTTSTPSTTTTPATTTTVTTTPTTTSPATTAAPPPAAPPSQAPPPAEPPNEPTHRHHRPHLPPEITIPPIPKAPEVPTVITVPPRLR